MKQNNTCKKIAITGGIGSGKSTVLKILQNLKYPVVSCDAIAKEIYQENTLLKKLQQNFSTAFVNGVLDRKKLADIVFRDREKLAILNAVTHPIIMQKLLLKMDTFEQSPCFAEVPLLFEGGFASLFDGVWVVMRPLEERITALQQRDNLTVQEIQDRMQNQWNYAKTINIEHTILYNTKDVKYLERQIQQVLHEIQKNNSTH